MFGHSPIESDRDRRVKVYADNTAVSASTAQSEYARYLNFIGDRFTAVSNTVGGVKTYDIALKYADKIIPYEAGVAKGSTPGYLNFDGDHFDVSSLASSMYTVTSTGRVKVNDLATIRKLRVTNTTNNTAVTVADDSGNDEIDLTFNNDDVIVLSNGTVVNTTPRRVNFSTDFTATDNSGSDRVDISLASNQFLPNPFGAFKWGLAYGSQGSLTGSFGDGLFSTGYTQDQGDVSGTNDATHGHARRYITSGADNDEIEVNIPNLTRLNFNPHLYLKMRIATIDDTRFFLGFHTGNIPSGDNEYLNDLSGFGISYQYDTAETEDTVLYINRNDGDAAENKVTTGQSLTNTTPFTIELVGDSANSRWGWNYNGGAFTYYTQGTAGETPATGTDLSFTFRIEQIGSAPATIDFWYIYLTQTI